MKKSGIVFLHLGYWLMYMIVFTCLLLATAKSRGPVSFIAYINALCCSPMALVAVYPGIFGFYISYTVLFKKFLEKKKILLLVITATGISFGVSLVIELLMRVLFTPPNYHLNWEDATVAAGFLIIAVALVHSTIALVMRGFIKWYSDLKWKAETDRKNYEMEISLIKAQINPHFLFNTINNIDMLILKNPEQASLYLNKLSDIMRFMLYEAKAEKIPLEKELSYIAKYLELQKIRSSNPDFIKYEVKGNAQALAIEPMLFIPFIENAFKHAGNKKQDNAVIININIDRASINFSCENNYESNPSVKPEYSGLGNELISRRLELLYPGKHKFERKTDNGIYKINLHILL